MTNKNELLATLTERFPAAFPVDPKAIRPLKIGAYQDLKAALPEVSARALRQVLTYYTRRLAYLRALSQGGERIGLDGNPVEPVTPEQQAHAAEKLKEALAWLAAKKALKAAAAPQPESKGKGKGKPREAAKPPQATPRAPMRPILSIKRGPA